MNQIFLDSQSVINNLKDKCYQILFAFKLFIILVMMKKLVFSFHHSLVIILSLSSFSAYSCSLFLGDFFVRRVMTMIAKFIQSLLSSILLDHFCVMFRMFYLDMLIETTLRTIALWAITNRTLIVARNFCSCTSMSLLLFIVNFKRHTQLVFMLFLV